MRLQGAAAFAAQAPKLSQTEIDQINDLFPAYLFRRRSTREIWTTCCRRHKVIGERITTNDEFWVLQAEHQREPHWNEKPLQGTVQCPFCGKPLIVKELGRTGRRENLTRWRRALVLHWDGKALWATAWDVEKDYTIRLTDPPKRSEVAIYRYQSGLAEAVKRHWYEDGFRYIDRQDEPLRNGKWKIQNPFGWSTYYGMGYDVIGVEELGKTPFRWCRAEEIEPKTEYFHLFLTACCFYPRQIEMLIKADMLDVVKDLMRGVKHAAAIDWSRTDPAEAFGLTRQELRAFLNTSRDVRTVELYHRLRRRVPLEECADWVSRDADIPGSLREAKRWNLLPEKLLRYLAAQGNGYGMGNTLITWRDYVTAGEGIGLQLYRENVLLPGNLRAAHENAEKKNRSRLQSQRDREKRDRLRKLETDYQERLALLRQKYAYESDGIMIRVPENGAEIVEEGRILQHCVGGYAHRHLEGKVTILFMRHMSHPDSPWITIQMNGNSIVQIHGYRNEGIHTAHGRFAPDPQETHREFLDGWLAWLKKGSPRRRDGSPKISKKKEVA